MLPGVYLMMNDDGRVIYVGKAKKLRNRVSQYFQDTASHSPKTRLMVSKISSFDVIVAASEFEALVLECSLIKRHQPKYNILLKDDKGYPYIRLDKKKAYPQITMANKVAEDGADYYGPFGSRSITQEIINTICYALMLPTCTKRFPLEVKDRPCLNYHMKQCDGWCQMADCRDAYLDRIKEAESLLRGELKPVSSKIRKQMQDAADTLNFELAASLRDRLKAVEALGQKQMVTAGSRNDTDVIGYAASASKICFSVLHYTGGDLANKEYEILTATEDGVSGLTALIKQYYFNRKAAPKVILLPFEIEDTLLIEQLLQDKFGRKTKIHVPQRGNSLRLIEMAAKNARDEAERAQNKDERISAAWNLLGKMAGLQAFHRAESYDISNLSGTDIVAGMVVYVDGCPKRSDYKRFQIQGMQDQDDYASMTQVLTRRFRHYIDGDKGFSDMPDLLLIDGGINHAKTAHNAMEALGVDVTILGMVKDNRHRTRALVTADGRQIAIDGNSAVFSLVGNIQEETHRFAINYHRKLRTKRLRYSELDNIPGVGPKRKELLLRVFKSLKGIGNAELSQLQRYLPKDTAMAVYQHFHEKTGG